MWQLGQPLWISPRGFEVICETDNLAVAAWVKGDPERDIAVHVMGRADWKWDEEFKIHIPCCSYQLWGDWKINPCGAGPLTGNQILTGRCSEHAEELDP